MTRAAASNSMHRESLKLHVHILFCTYCTIPMDLSVRLSPTTVQYSTVLLYLPSVSFRYLLFRGIPTLITLCLLTLGHLSKQ